VSYGDATPSPSPAAVGSEPERTASKPLSQNFSTKPVVHKLPHRHFDDVEEHENPILNVGDMINHPQLGLCEVVGEDDSGGTQIRVPSGRVRVLKLEALMVRVDETDAEGRNVFKVLGPRRRN
jgi:hypothetical protein